MPLFPLGGGGRGWLHAMGSCLGAQASPAGARGGWGQAGRGAHIPGRCRKPGSCTCFLWPWLSLLESGARCLWSLQPGGQLLMGTWQGMEGAGCKLVINK